MQSQPGAQEGDFMKMSQGEQGNVDVQYGVDSGDQGKKKSSMVGKVKDKAKKISHKIKGATKKKKDEHGNDVEGDTSSSSSEDEREPSEQQQQVDISPTPEVRHDGVVHGGAGADKSRDLDLDREKEQGGGLSGGTQAYDDPSAPAPGSNWPRTDEELRSTTNPAQDEVPAAPGQESSGVSPIMASSGLGGQPEDTEVRSREPDSSLAAGALAGKSEEKIPEGIMQPTKSEEEPKPVVDGIDSSGRDLVSSEVVDDKQKEVAPGDPSDKQLKSSDSQKGWMQTVKNVFMGSPKSTTTESTAAPVEGTGQDQKTWTEKARDAAVSAKDTAASKLPSSTGPKEDMPVSEQGADTKPSITSRAMESATATKDTVASKLGYDQSGAQSTETPAVTEADPSKPASQGGITQKVMGVKDAVASKLGYNQSGAQSTETPAVTEADPAKPAAQGGITQKVMGVKDAVASKLGYSAGAGTEGEVGTKPVEGEKNSKLFTPDDDDTALSQKITDMLTLGGSKNTPANTPTSDASAGQESGKGGGVMDKVTGVMGSFLGKKQPDQDKPAATTPSDAPVKDTVMSDATA